MSFDLRTHVRDKKNGQVIAENHYKLIIDGGIMTFERPLNSGTWYNADGTFLRQDKVDTPVVVKPQAEVDMDALLFKVAELEVKNAELKAAVEDSGGEAAEPEEAKETPKAGFSKPQFLK